ncbi:MAG: methionine synthase [Methanosphaera stadtmanae]|nr:methionine synthase [Methanosphaera stadtmanae]
MNVITSIVGSYPTKYSKVKNIKDKLYFSLGLFDPYKQAIIDSVTHFVKSDLDIICDGQVRNNMVNIFVKNINGFEIIDDTAYIKGKITPPPHPITTKDLKFTYKLSKKLDNKFKLHASLEKIFAHEEKGIKGIITGPTTLIHCSVIDNFYTSREDAIYDMAKALAYEAKELEKAGACIIQIDEPFISLKVEDIEVSQKGIEIISNSVNIPVALHVCGNLDGIMEKIVSFDVDILDFEFSGTPENIKLLEKTWDKNYDKIVIVSCIDTKIDYVDDLNNVNKIIKEVTKITQQKNIIIEPDCGMRRLSEDLSQKKLDILKKIKKEGI